MAWRFLDLFLHAPLTTVNAPLGSILFSNGEWLHAAQRIFNSTVLLGANVDLDSGTFEFNDRFDGIYDLTVSGDSRFRERAPFYWRLRFEDGATAGPGPTCSG